MLCQVPLFASEYTSLFAILQRAAELGLTYTYASVVTKLMMLGVTFTQPQRTQTAAAPLAV